MTDYETERQYAKHRRIFQEKRRKDEQLKATRGKFRPTPEAEAFALLLKKAERLTW